MLKCRELNIRFFSKYIIKLKMGRTSTKKCSWSTHDTALFLEGLKIYAYENFSLVVFRRHKFLDKSISNCIILLIIQKTPKSLGVFCEGLLIKIAYK